MHIIDPSSADEALSEVKAGQRVWLRLSADATRAHTPSLKLRLLADCHPDVRAAIGAKANSTRNTAASSSCKPKGITCTLKGPAVEEELSRHTNDAPQSDQSAGSNTIHSAPLAAPHFVDPARSLSQSVHMTHGAAHVDELTVDGSSGSGGVGRRQRPAAMPRSRKTPVVCIADAIACGLSEAMQSADSAAAGLHEAAAAAPHLMETSWLPLCSPTVLPEVSSSVAAQVRESRHRSHFLWMC